MNESFMWRFITQLLVFWIVPLACALAAETQESVPASEQKWIRLFDGKSLDGWYTTIQNQPKNEDPAKYFQVHDGLIHVYKDQVAGSPVPNGYIATDAEYANYHLRMEFKWGPKRFRPRAMQRRDAGLLYHVVAPDVVWPRSIECQIQENDVGDCFTVRGTQVVASVEIASIDTPSGNKRLPRYKPEADGGTPQTIGDGATTRIVKSSTPEHDGWNTVEVIVRGSQGSEHIVNGQTVFRAKDLHQLTTPLSASPAPKKGSKDEAAKKWKPLGSGRIALQCEYAEVFYRNIEIRQIPDGPLMADK